MFKEARRTKSIRILVKWLAIQPITDWINVRFRNMAQILTAQSVVRLGKSDIQTQLARCPSLPSLGSINKALQGLLLGLTCA